jgi:hypothetical protein
MSIITISIDHNMHNEAQTRAKSLPIWRLSYRGAEANEVGVLGEVVVEHWLKSHNIEFIDNRNKTTHDYLLIDLTSTFDVKTKDRTVPFEPNYECTIPLYNHEHQKPKYYIFVSLERKKNDPNLDISRFHTAYIIGGLNQEQLESRARKFDVGYIDKSNKMSIKMDCLNVYGYQVSPPEDVITKWKAISPLEK